jgi:hypothetical protein
MIGFGETAQRNAKPANDAKLPTVSQPIISLSYQKRRVPWLATSTISARPDDPSSLPGPYEHEAAVFKHFGDHYDLRRWPFSETAMVIHRRINDEMENASAGPLIRLKARYPFRRVFCFDPKLQPVHQTFVPVYLSICRPM